MHESLGGEVICSICLVKDGFDTSRRCGNCIELCCCFMIHMVPAGSHLGRSFSDEDYCTKEAEYCKAQKLGPEAPKDTICCRCEAFDKMPWWL